MLEVIKIHSKDNIYNFLLLLTQLFVIKFEIFLFFSLNVKVIPSNFKLFYYCKPLIEF